MINVVPKKIKSICLNLYLHAPDAISYLLLFLIAEAVYGTFVHFGFYTDTLTGIFSFIGIGLFVALIVMKACAAYIKKRARDRM